MPGAAVERCVPEWAPGLALPGGEVLQRLIGRGGTAELWEATRPSGLVAIKALHPELGARRGVAAALRREGRLGRRIRHASLVPILGEGEAAGRAYLVMELLHGSTLQQAWPCAMRRAAVGRLLAGPADALRRLHVAGVVHGDVKPANLFLESSGRLRLLDLGAARMAGNSALDESNWSPPHGLPLATPGWAAPERLRGDPPDPRDDVHSLALVAQALLRGPPTASLRRALGPRAHRPTCPLRLMASLRPWSLPGWWGSDAVAPYA